MLPPSTLLMNYASSFLSSSDLQIASAVPTLRSAILLLASVGVAIVALLIVLRQNSGIGFRLRAYWRQFQNLFSNFKVEARLNEVVCGVCRRGTGVYDPIYMTYQGQPFIEGTCNCCGAYVRARLQ